MLTELRTGTGIESRLNQLYWNSGRTIDEIVEDLGVSRNLLYSSIDPIPAGSLCPMCTGMLVFTNRTSRASGSGTCESCGMESEVAEPPGEAETDSMGSAPSMNGNGRRLDRLQDELAGVDTRRAAMIGGAAAAGVLVGTLFIRTLRS